MEKIVNFSRLDDEQGIIEQAFIREAAMVEEALLSTPEAQAVEITDAERDAAYEKFMERVKSEA